MKTDYTIPPTEEFKFLSELNFRHSNDPYHWLTLQKAVMNDYWFDAIDKETPWTKEYIDHFMHKIYFCWQEFLTNANAWGEEE